LDEGKLKGKPGPATALLRPILDTYMDSAVALVGCKSSGLDRYSCEYDVVVVSNRKLPPTSLRIGEVFVDLVFSSEGEVLKPADPEHSMALAQSKLIRDSNLVLSTSAAANAAVLSESARKASRTRLASAVKTTGRAEEALTRKSLSEADFWLVAASYEFAYAWLLSKEILPSPSHLLSQLRRAPRGVRGFEGFSMGAGLESAGRAGCGARLEGVTVLHDLLKSRTESRAAKSSWPTERTMILGAKARELVTRVELAECYSFLGQEMVDAFMALANLEEKGSVSSLTLGKDRLLGERLVRQLGLARSEKALRAALDAMKRQTSLLARRA
jgi:hypothetical protein